MLWIGVIMENDISDEEMVIHLYEKTRTFPKKIIAKQFLQSNHPTMIYIPKRTCNIIVSFNDEDHTIGSSKCSECHADIDIFSKYCYNCGAKCIGRKVEGELNDED